MKESFEDKITKRIKEVLDQYEPDYSPQAWEKLRKQIPVPEFWLKKLFMKYRFWIAGTTIIGVLFFTYQVFKPDELNKEAAIELPDYRPVNSSESGKPEARTSTVKPIISHSEDSSTISRNQYQNHVIASGLPAIHIVDSQKTVYYETAQMDSNYYYRIEIPMDYSVNEVLKKELYLRTPDISSQLIRIKLPGVENSFIPDKSGKYDRKSQFQWPEFGSLSKTGESYNKFVGPNKLALFYSPEIHYNDSLKTFGVSHGFGITVEGPIRSSISISAGLSYQTMNFQKTVFSEKVPSRNFLHPTDTTQYIDSIGIMSGSYRYFELPVSVNLKLLESSRSQFWLGTGISSIAFLKQEYISETIVGDISEKATISANAWENVHLLASLNFSLLYRYEFSDRFVLHTSIQYKHHLGPLGYNSMKLDRLNLQIGLVYHFGRND